MSQKNVIETHLYNTGSITALEAINLYKILRLAPIVFNLRKEGVNINTTLCGKTGYAMYNLS